LINQVESGVYQPFSLALAVFYKVSYNYFKKLILRVFFKVFMADVFAKYD